MGKSLFQSKTFWVGVLTIVGGIATAIAGQLEAGGGLTVVGVANILLRLVTKERIIEILPRLAILFALAGSSMTLAGESDYMLVDDRPAFASQLPAATPTAPDRQAYDRAMASGRPLDGRRGIPHLAVWTRSGAVWSVKHNTGVQSAEFYRRVFRSVGRNKLRRRAAHHQAAKRTVKAEESVGSRGSLFGIAPEKLAGDPSPEVAVALQEQLEHVLAAQRPLHRRMLELRLGGDSIKDIAIDCERTEHQVRRVLKRFRDALQQDLLTDCV